MYQYVFHVSISSTFDYSRMQYQAFRYPRGFRKQDQRTGFQPQHRLYTQSGSTNSNWQAAEFGPSERPYMILQVIVRLERPS